MSGSNTIVLRQGKTISGKLKAFELCLPFWETTNVLLRMTTLQDDFLVQCALSRLSVRAGNRILIHSCRVLKTQTRRRKQILRRADGVYANVRLEPDDARQL